MPPKSSESYRTPKSDAECLWLSGDRRRLNAVRRAAGEPLCTFDEWRKSIFPATWPNPLDREDFDAWIRRECRSGPFALPFAGGSSTANPVKREDFVKQVAETDFSKEHQTCALLDIMTQRTRCWLPMGYEPNQHITCRFVPEAHGLLPSKNDTLQIQDPILNNVLPISFLGVNFSIEPRSPNAIIDNSNLSRESTKSGESDDGETDGFVFHQLGKLEFTQDKVEDQKDLAEAKWKDSHSYVVGRLDPSNGRVNGIWVMYDMWPVNFEGERVEAGEIYGAIDFSCAKIGGSLGEFGDYDRELKWSHMFYRRVELVRVMKCGDKLRRVTIANPEEIVQSHAAPTAS